MRVGSADAGSLSTRHPKDRLIATTTPSPPTAGAFGLATTLTVPHLVGMSTITTLRMPRFSGEHLTEVLPDGRHVINGEWVLPHDPRGGCWCGETLHGACAHQRLALGAVRAHGLIPMPALSLGIEITTRIASEAASHPGIGPREWLRLLARVPDDAWRIAGYRKAVSHPDVVRALLHTNDPRVTRRLLMQLPITWWGEGREELLRQVGEIAGAIESRWMAARRIEREGLRLGAIREAALGGAAWAQGLLSDLGWRVGSEGIWRRQGAQIALPHFART